MVHGLGIINNFIYKKAKPGFQAEDPDFRSFKNFGSLLLQSAASIPYFYQNVGVACGPGYPLQVLALPAHKPGARSGLYAPIPNAACLVPFKAKLQSPSHKPRILQTNHDLWTINHDPFNNFYHLHRQKQQNFIWL
jgi:hypothetical protein